jgi:hypothetical protein
VGGTTCPLAPLAVSDEANDTSGRRRLGGWMDPSTSGPAAPLPERPLRLLGRLPPGVGTGAGTGSASASTDGTGKLEADASGSAPPACEAVRPGRMSVCKPVPVPVCSASASVPSFKLWPGLSPPGESTVSGRTAVERIRLRELAAKQGAVRVMRADTTTTAERTHCSQQTMEDARVTARRAVQERTAAAKIRLCASHGAPQASAVSPAWDAEVHWQVGYGVRPG